MMEGHVAWIIECTVKDGQFAALTELLDEMVEGTSAEPATLAYEWYLSGDQGSLHGFEKYADSDAMIAHVNGFLEKWAARFTGCVVIDSLLVYGDPSPAAREILDGWHATYMGPWKGFSRFSAES
jgi:quinol monooxygenase YgiN